MQRFDAIVVGTGVAGQTAAEELSRAGLHVAIVDKRAYGGTCALRGCEPKKVLYSAAEVVERAAGQAANGLSGSLAIDWPSLIEFKRTFTDPLTARAEDSMSDAGVTALSGVARFTSSETMDVGSEAYSAQHFVLAPGAVASPLGIPGQEHVLDSEQFMASGQLGEHIVFIGGGYISFEFAHIAAAAGARTTILQRGASVLTKFDPDLAEMLVSGYRDAGIDVRTDAPVSEVRAVDDGFHVMLADGSSVPCDMVVHGAGRAPDLIGLDLDTAGVTYGRRGIEVDSAMRSTSNPRVFAAGDAAALGAPLTPVGIAQGRIAAANIIEPGSAWFTTTVVPSVVFSDPPMASVGLSEAEATSSGLQVDVVLTDTSEWSSSRRTGIGHSGAKTIVESESGRIVGAHLMGHGAQEVINVFAAAMLGGLTASELKSALWAYPTAGSDIVYLL